MAPTIANKRIIDVSINHKGYAVYIILPILVICELSAKTPSHKLEVMKYKSLLYIEDDSEVSIFNV